MGKKLPSRALRPVLPDRLAVGTQGVDHAPPVATAFNGGVQLAAEPAQKPHDALAGRDRLRRELQRWDVPMRLRQQSVARYHQDVAPVPGGGEAQPGIDHAESRAENDHRIVRIDRRVLGRSGADGEALASRRLRFMPKRKHRKVGLQHPAIGEMGADPALRFAHRHGFPIDDQQPAPGCSSHLLEQRSQIAAIQPPRREPPAVGTRVVATRDEPGAKMVGLVREGTHVAGGHIDLVVALHRRIGEPHSELPASLDQRDANAVAAIAQQMRGKQHAACAPTDDDDRALTCHAVSRLALARANMPTNHIAASIASGEGSS